MQITSKFCSLAAAAVFGLLLSAVSLDGAAAQSTKNKPGQFGPRAKAGQQQQQAAQTAPAAEIVATHGAWKIQCETSQKASATEGQTENQRQCGLVQGAQSEKNPKAGLTLVVVKAKQGDKEVTMMRVMAPIGVYLPTGVALEIDGAAVGRVPFTRCLPQICIAFAEASPETLVKLKKGTAANFIVYEAPGIGLPMKMSLEGFSAGLAALDKL